MVAAEESPTNLSSLAIKSQKVKPKVSLIPDTLSVSPLSAKPLAQDVEDTLLHRDVELQG